MSPLSAVAIYFVIWWTILFAVLPLRVRQQDEESRVPGTERGAPAQPHLVWKAIVTTLVASVIFGVFYWAYETRAVTLDDIPFLPRFDTY